MNPANSEDCYLEIHLVIGIAAGRMSQHDFTIMNLNVTFLVNSMMHGWGVLLV